MTHYAEFYDLVCIGMNKIKTAVIGTGYLGKYHVEKFAALPQSQLVAICDIDKTHSCELSEKYHVVATDDYHTLSHVDAVSIATPTPSHFEIARFFLERAVHVFIEKPITTSIDEADALINLAQKNNCILQVGHVERFNSAFQFIQPMLTVPRFIESQRLTPFKLRGSDVSVILDLMIHDIDIALSIARSPITDIRATGANVLTSFIDIANARIEFENGCVASLTASRINSASVRRIRVFQNDAYLLADLHKNICRIRQKTADEMYPGVPNIDNEDVRLEKGDALNHEISSFLKAILENEKVIVSGIDARNALNIAIKITDIVNHNNERYQ